MAFQQASGRNVGVALAIGSDVEPVKFELKLQAKSRLGCDWLSALI
jgi:hypothetical protein